MDESFSQRFDTIILPKDRRPAYEDNPEEWMELINGLLAHGWVENEAQLNKRFGMFLDDAAQFEARHNRKVEFGAFGCHSVKIADRDIFADPHATYVQVFGYDAQTREMDVNWITPDGKNEKRLLTISAAISPKNKKDSRP